MPTLRQKLSFTPAPHPPRSRLTPALQRRFIAALAECGLVREAARIVGVSVAALETLRYGAGGADFRRAWDAARNGEAARLARAARRQDGGPGRDGMRGARLVCRSARPSQRTSRAAFAGPEPAADDPLLGFAPFLHPCPRKNSITPDRQRAFVSALAASGSVKQAARAIGASLEALYRLRARAGAEGFAAAWELAIDLGVARLEDTALARAMEGEMRPIVARGEIIGEYRVHNEALVMFLLRHRRAARYGPAQDRVASERPDEDAVIASIHAKLDRARAQMAAREAAAG